MSQTEASVSTTDPHDGIGSELRKEGYTMSLYIAISLLAALLAISNSEGRGDAEVAGIIWGTTIGLALAHLFAFRLSSRLVGAGDIHPHDAQIAGAQLAGAAMVAVLCTIPVVLMSQASELDAVRLVLAGYVSLVGYQVAMSNGSTRARALIYASIVLAVALAIAVAKNLLSGH